MMTNWSPDELCICGHTHEVHFGHDCSRLLPRGKPCACKQFVSCEFAVQIFETLESLTEIADKYSVTCEMEQEFRAIHEEFCERIELAQAAIRKAKGE